MKVEPAYLLIAGAAAAGLFLAWRASKIVGDAAQAVGTAIENGAINPASRNNLINRGVEAVGSQVSGDPNWTLGGTVYDWLNPDVLDRVLKGEPVPNAPATSPATEKKTGEWWNPAQWSFAGVWGS